MKDYGKMSQQTGKRQRVRPRRAIVVGTSFAVAAVTVVTLYSVGAFAGGAPAPVLNQPNSNASNVPPSSNVVVNPGPGPQFLEETSAGLPTDVTDVPTSIPPQGVLVNDDFELFSLDPSSIALGSETAQDAIAAVAKYMTVTDATSVTTLEAIVTLPGSIVASGQSTVHQEMDVPSWIVDYSVPPTEPTPAAEPGEPVPTNLPTFSNVVAAVNSSGVNYFSTTTP